MTNVEISFLKFEWDKMSDVEKEPYSLKSKEKLTSEIDNQQDPVSSNGPAKPTKKGAAEDERIKSEMKKIEAMARNLFVEEEKTFDYSKKRATDMKQNTEVYLPGVMGLEVEAGLEVLRQE
jgi:hypothetical protein